MHIAEGILSAPVLAGGAAFAAAGVAAGLKKLDYQAAPRAAVLCSAFYVVSLVHVPIGPGSAHLILNGLVGLILGWVAFPALLVALFLQAVMFGYGGLTVLGVNTLNMALPAVIVYHLFAGRVRTSENRRTIFICGFLAGALAIALSGILMSISLFLSGKEWLGVVAVILAAHGPVMIIEGLVTGSVCLFLRQVRPEVLNPDFGETRYA